MKNDLVFITRDGCVNTPDMLINLDDALRVIGLPLDYQVVHLASPPATDPRTVYPTPTVLYRLQKPNASWRKPQHSIL